MATGTARVLVAVLTAGMVVGLASAPAPAVGPAWVAQDVIAGSGLAASTETWEAVPVDFDDDGDQDVWIGYHDQGGKLWRNNGFGAYTQVITAAWPRKNSERKIPDRHDCAWADVDQNGLIDSYCAAGRGTSNPVKYGRDNELWLQQSPGQFSDVGTAWGIGELCGRSHYVAFLDADGDAFPDLFVGNADPRVVSGDPCDVAANGLTNEQMKLYLDDGGAGFSYAPGSGIAGYGGVRCAVVTDYNGDGWDDLFVCGKQSRLYRNNLGLGFTDVAPALGVTTNYCDLAFGDLDRDGDQDLVTCVKAQFAYRLNTNGTFGPTVRIGAVPAGSSGRSLALGDADGDGDLDVYALISNLTAKTNANDTLYLNDALTFTAIAVPGASGIGDAVTALDGNGDGRSEFLVLNGVETIAPLQLIRVAPAP